MMTAEQPVDSIYNDVHLKRTAFSSLPAVCRSLTESDLKNKYFLYQGSGGEITTSLNFTLSGGSIDIYKEPQSNLKIAIDSICISFGLNIRELSEILSVKSRKSIYNWIKGETQPRKSTAKKIYDLLLISNSWKNSGFSADRELLHQPVADGKSVFDLLSEKQLNKELIIFSGSRLHAVLSKGKSLSDPFA